MTLWSDDKTNEDIQKLAETNSNSVVYNLHEDLLCVKEQLAKAKEDYKALFSAFESCQDELKESNERESILSCQLDSHIERVAELEKENKRESMELRSRLGSALGRNSEYNSAIETVAYRCFLAGLTTEKPREPNVQNNTATAISHFNVMVDRHARSASRHILEQLRKEQE